MLERITIPQELARRITFRLRQPLQHPAAGEGMVEMQRINPADEQESGHIIGVFPGFQASTASAHRQDTQIPPRSYPGEQQGEAEGVASDIEDFLKDLKGQPFRFFPNPGNGGDSLIAVGTYQVFNQLGLDYHFAGPTADPARLAGETIVIGGGGNLIELYRDVRSFIAPRYARAKRLIILPHTITAHGDLIEAFGSNVEVICRERMSHAFVSAHARHCRVHLMDDMALSLDVEETMFGTPRIRMPQWKEAARYLRRYWRRATLPRQANRRAFNCFRTDREKTAVALPPDNVDLAAVLVAGVKPEFCAYAGARDIFNVLRQVDVINTNRLHMAIAGILLGKQVNFHDNSYGKNRAVYEFSIEDRFPTVTWMGGSDRP